MMSIVSAFGVFTGATLAEARAKLRLATTAATGRDATAADAAAITLLRGLRVEHPIFGSGYTADEADDAAREFMRWTD